MYQIENISEFMDVGGENGKEASEQELVGPSGKQIEAPDTAIHDDSGHESNMSTPDAPSTPHEGERSITPGIFNEYLRVYSSEFIRVKWRNSF